MRGAQPFCHALKIPQRHMRFAGTDRKKCEIIEKKSLLLFSSSLCIACAVGLNFRFSLGQNGDILALPQNPGRRAAQNPESGPLRSLESRIQNHRRGGKPFTPLDWHCPHSTLDRSGQISKYSCMYTEQTLVHSRVSNVQNAFDLRYKA